MAELTDVTGVSDSRAEDLQEEGFTTVDDIATTTATDLAEVKGIGASTAEGLIESAQDVIRDDTLDAAENEQTQETPDDDEPVEEEDEYDVSEEDLRDMVEETESSSTEEPVAEEEADEAEEDEAEADPTGPFDIELVVETEDQYDYMVYMMLDIRLGNVFANGPQREVAEEILSQLRPAAGSVTVELSLTLDELNTLDATLRRMETKLQGTANNEPYRAIRAIHQQVETFREESL